ncbi:ribosome silencing factor [Noviherbaspirillum sp.]|uniref:ribosome silencing factor n=1 Tax=Noviherbaspirillum sp. TaxID=1926288 RepID=UPI002B4655FB|nr:ribosome silencing factor [Noviherbaspirillum sp.]HJV79503.1 ribosome silencing factor [Noviherbaspirillum sp.]
MDIKKLQAIVIDALEDVKAQDIRAYDTVHLTSMFDRLAIASGTSNRQTKALAASVRDKVKEHGGNVVSIEGEETGEWVLVDLGDMVVHIMQPAIRDYYRLEEIWGDKEIKLGAAKRISKRTASEETEEAPKKRSRHLAASQTTVDDEPKKPARKTAAKTATKPATKTTAAKSPARKTAKTPVGKTVKVAAAKTAAPRKTAAKRASTKKAAV